MGKTTLIHIPFTDEEIAKLEEAAKRERLHLDSWAKQKLLQRLDYIQGGTDDEEEGLSSPSTFTRKR